MSQCSRSAFTLIELLVTITIIAMLAAVGLGALHAARQTARESKTKALIAKLDQVVSQRYSSYVTRRVPISSRGLQPTQAAQIRLDALRDLMRMEMPERWNDILCPPIPLRFDGGSAKPLREPTLYRRYNLQFTQAQSALIAQGLSEKEALKRLATYGPAECLYMILSIGGSEAMEHFRDSEIGDADEDGLPEFHDAWGRPIMFLRWAPGFTPISDIQSGDATEDHDPFDSRRVDRQAYRLMPLVYSAGRDHQYDLAVTSDYVYRGDPYASGDGAPFDEDGDGLGHLDNIHNHHMTQN